MAWLETLGHRSLFLDFDASAGIEGGCNWEQKLYRELRVCRALIVVCTEHSMQIKMVFRGAPKPAPSVSRSFH